MLILAFESSAKAASVALVRDGSLVSQYSQCSALTHSRTLLPMAEDMLKNAELTIGDVDLFAVAHGPGSFTGVRIGVSTVKGLAWAGGKPCVGVSTLEAMAWHGLAAGPYVCPVMDARRQQVYNALFRVSGDRVERLCDDRALSLGDLKQALSVFTEPVVLVGDGAKLCYDFFGDETVHVRLAPANKRIQTASSVAMAAWQAIKEGRTVTAEALMPSYLRLPQAQRELNKRLGRE